MENQEAEIATAVTLASNLFLFLLLRNMFLSQSIQLDTWVDFLSRVSLKFVSRTPWITCFKFNLDQEIPTRVAWPAHIDRHISLLQSEIQPSIEETLTDSKQLLIQ